LQRKKFDNANRNKDEVHECVKAKGFFIDAQNYKKYKYKRKYKYRENVHRNLSKRSL